MGQKVHPIGLRLGINKTWQSRWYAEKNYADFLHEDLTVKKFIKKSFYHAGISRIEIERAADRTYGLRQDASGADTGAEAGGSVRDMRCDDGYRSGLRGRGCRELPSAASPGSRL